MMKRDADAEVKARARRHQNLLQDYLELQKEFETKKKRCESLKNKRATLMAEVRFLRQRYQQLVQNRTANEKFLDLNSSNVGLIQDINQVRAGENLVGKTYLATELHPVLINAMRKSRGLPALPESLLLPPNKKTKTRSSKGKGTEKKKKITWQAQAPIEV